jgi:hypothetical protein
VNQVGIKGVKVATRPGTKSRKENMLNFHNQKLRTNSINEDNYVEKADEDRDSGTESDEEIDDPDLPSGKSILIFSFTFTLLDLPDRK